MEREPERERQEQSEEPEHGELLDPAEAVQEARERHEEAGDESTSRPTRSASRASAFDRLGTGRSPTIERAATG